MHSAGNAIQDEGVAALGEALAVNSSLTQLHLGREEQASTNSWHTSFNKSRTTDNEFGSKGACALFGSLKANTALQTLKVESEQQQDRKAKQAKKKSP